MADEHADSNEGSSFLMVLPNNGTTLTADNYTTLIGAFAGASSVQTITSLYPLSAYSNTPNPVFEALAHIGTVVFKCSTALALQNTLNAGVPTYSYFFNHTPTCPWLPNNQLAGLSVNESLAYLGPTHTAELPYVWASLNQTNVEPGCQFTPADYQISEILVAAWTSMARNGNPGNVTTWPKYDNTSYQGLLINDGVSAGFINNTECLLWLPILSQQFAGGASFGINTSSTGNPTSSSTPKPTASSIGAGSSLKTSVLSVVVGLIVTIVMIS